MSGVRDFFVRDAGLKLISLGFAFLLWLSISGNEVLEQAITVPVKFFGLASELEMTGEPPRQVDVHIRSSRSRHIESGDISVIIDLSDARPGRRVIPISGTAVKVPAGVQVISVTPPRLVLEIEPSLQKSVPVRADIIGTLPEGYELTGVSMEPSDVWITGPRSHVEKVHEAVTESINVTDRSYDYSVTANLTVDDPVVRLARAEPVRVVVAIQEKRSVRVLAGVPVRIDSSVYNVQFSPRRVQVVASLPRSFAGQLDAAAFEAVLPVATLEPRADRYRVRPEIHFPAELEGTIRIESVRPETLTVQIHPRR